MPCCVSPSFPFQILIRDFDQLAWLDRCKQFCYFRHHWDVRLEPIIGRAKNHGGDRTRARILLMFDVRVASKEHIEASVYGLIE